MGNATAGFEAHERLLASYEAALSPHRCAAASSNATRDDDAAAASSGSVASDGSTANAGADVANAESRAEDDTAEKTRLAFWLITKLQSRHRGREARRLAEEMTGSATTIKRMRAALEAPNATAVTQ